MSATRYLIETGTPVPIFPGGQQGSRTVYNDSLNNVVLSPDPNTMTGVPLKAGNSVVWDAGKPLYAYVLDVGAPSSVTLFDSAGVLPPNTISADRRFIELVPGSSIIDPALGFMYTQNIYGLSPYSTVRVMLANYDPLNYNEALMSFVWGAFGGTLTEETAAFPVGMAAGTVVWNVPVKADLATFTVSAAVTSDLFAYVTADSGFPVDSYESTVCTLGPSEWVGRNYNHLFSGAVRQDVVMPSRSGRCSVYLEQAGGGSSEVYIWLRQSGGYLYHATVATTSLVELTFPKRPISIAVIPSGASFLHFSATFLD